MIHANKNNMKHLLHLLVIAGLIVSFFPPKITQADALIVNLTYDQSAGTLSLDNDGVTYSKNTPTPLTKLINPSTSGADKIVLLQSNGEQAFVWQFDPQNGSFSIDLPYFSTAKNLEIINIASNKTIIQTDLSNLSTCNSNGICEFGKGENIYTCVADCASGAVKYDEATLQILKTNNGTVRDVATGKILLRQTPNTQSSQNNIIYIAVIAGVVILLGIIILIIVKRKK
jgi:hypothetical protein